MTTIIRDDGFHPSAPAEFNDDHIWITSDTPLDELSAGNAKTISIEFPSFADGRGFGLARRLRADGFTGTLRAVGHVIADQYAMARRVGFDEVEISDDLAARQPADQWLARADWQAFDYQTRLMQKTPTSNHEGSNP